jgi:hypothetical protein
MDDDCGVVLESSPQRTTVQEEESVSRFFAQQVPHPSPE